MKLIVSQILLVLLVRSSTNKSLSYIDPLAGSVILQVILGGIAGVGVFMKMYWHRVVGFLGRSNEDTPSK